MRRAWPDGPAERPYDSAGWTLPAQMGVRVVTIERTFEPPPTSRLTSATIAPQNVWGERKPTYWLVEARGTAGAVAVNRLLAAGALPSWTTVPIDASGFRYPAGSLVVPYVKTAEAAVVRVAHDLGLRADAAKGKVPTATQPIGRGRIALYRPFTENIDEGWTRWVLEQYEFKYTSITDAAIRAGNLRAQFDAIILPSSPADRLMAGYSSDTVPAEYSGGLTQAGVESLKAFVEAGGELICLGQSTELGISMFDLPLRDVARDATDRLFVPGSILRLDLDATRPLGYGMETDTAAFFAFSSAFETSGDLETVARYGRQNVLLSGWLEGEQYIAGRAAVVQARVADGRVVLLGFPVQHRGQSLATFRLLFNAVLIAPSPLPTNAPRLTR